MTDTSPVPQDDKLLGALSYVSFVSIIMFVVKRENMFVVHHARQGIVLFVGSLFWPIPIVGWIIAAISYVLMVIGFIKAYNGEKYEMPVVFDLTKKFS